jgi:hypothetical protein
MLNEEPQAKARIEETKINKSRYTAQRNFKIYMNKGIC